MGPIERLEQKYGIKVRDDSFWNPVSQRYVKRYRIYTADGCPWENGLSYRGLFKECRECGESMLSIKAAVEKRRVG